jgi:uncharacterized membrane protein YfcA
MITVAGALLLIIGAAGLVFAVYWARLVAAHPPPGPQRPSFLLVALGFVTNFFDTLGIGSFATTTAVFKMMRLVPDEKIPGTMVVGHGLPVVVQGLIFIAAVKVESAVLLSLTVALIVGAWLGAGMVSKLPRRKIQIGMGVALLSAAIFMTMSQVGLFPGGGDALGLPFDRLLFATAVVFVLGILIMLGIGHYAPCLVLLSLLGMDPRAAFPIMMGGGSLAAMVGGARFVSTGRYDLRAALGLVSGGIPAVLLAGLVVKSLPLDALRWMVVVVVLIAAGTMLRSAFAKGAEASTE